MEHDVVERRFTYSATTYHIPSKVPERTDSAIGTDVSVGSSQHRRISETQFAYCGGVQNLPFFQIQLSIGN